MISAAIRIPTPEEIKARRARLGYDGPQQRPRPQIALVANPEPIMTPSNANQTREEQQEDWHVRAWWAWKAWRGEPMPVSSYIKALCWLAGMTIDEFRGSRMTRFTTRRRHAIIKSIDAAYPAMSLVAIGRLTNRDHTSIGYILHRTKYRGSRPKSKGTREDRELSLPEIRQIRADYAGGGYSYNALARKHGVHAKTIRNVVLRKTYKEVL